MGQVERIFANYNLLFYLRSVASLACCCVLLLDSINTMTTINASAINASAINASVTFDPISRPLEDLAEEFRAGRLRDGKCPECGTQLYETVRKGVLRKKVTRPLSIAGQVVRGQCVPCLNGHADGGDASAVALAAIADSEATSISTATATPILSFPTQMEANYSGNFNNYGERHGEGELGWSNGDRYKGTDGHLATDN